MEETRCHTSLSGHTCPFLRIASPFLGPNLNPSRLRINSDTPRRDSWGTKNIPPLDPLSVWSSTHPGGGKGGGVVCLSSQNDGSTGGSYVVVVLLGIGVVRVVFGDSLHSRECAHRQPVRTSVPTGDYPWSTRHRSPPPRVGGPSPKPPSLLNLPDPDPPSSGSEWGWVVPRPQVTSR